MTENEAKQKLENLHYKIIHTSFCNKVYEIEIVALCMAKDALEEIQQYRAIGTVEGYKRALEISKENFRVSMEYKAKVQEYETIGTIDEFKALKEKSVAKKPDYECDGCWDGHIVIDTWICPNCEKHYEVDYDDYDYCPNCGQHIDHSGLTEDD